MSTKRQIEVDHDQDGGDAWSLSRIDACGIIPTCTASTMEQYRNDVRSILKSSGAPRDCDDGARLSHGIAWFSTQDGKWAASTVRKYKAALEKAVCSWRDAGLDPDGWRAPALLAEINAADLKPRLADAPPQTSALKRKYFTIEERNKLFHYFSSRADKTNRLLAGFVVFGTLVSARPCEWRTARIEGDELLIDCAKNTNGRGVAKTRPLLLNVLTKIERDGLERFVAAMRDAASEAVVWQRLHDRLAKALNRGCKAVNIAPICLYTVRQQGIATAKRFMLPVQVAAHAGHYSVKTAREHYAHKRGGWRMDPHVRPSPAIVAMVRTPSNLRVHATPENILPGIVQISPAQQNRDHFSTEYVENVPI